MKQFLTRVFFFSIAIIIVLSLSFIVRNYKEDIKELIGYEVYHSINKAKSKKSGVKKLILGDSVAKQAYDNLNYNDSLYSLACNQAISIVGQYILLYEFLESYTFPEELSVVLIYRPSSFRNDLDQPFTFNYFLKPFYKTKYDFLLSDLAKDKIMKVPYYFLVKVPFIRQSRWAPNNKFHNGPNDFEISILSKEYLLKIEKLCANRNVKSFKIICPYISNKYMIESFDEFNNQIFTLGLDSIFEGYFDNIVFLNRDLFIDDIHLENARDLKINYLNF